MTLKDRPTLRSLGAPVAGQTWRYTIRSKPGRKYATYLSIPGPGWIWIGMDRILLNPALLVPLHSGTQGTSGETTFAIPLPSNLNARHLTLVVQGLEIQTAHAEATNAIFLGQR